MSRDLTAALGREVDRMAMEGSPIPDSLLVPIPALKRAVDALCRAHGLALALDSARAGLDGTDLVAPFSVPESALTKQLEQAKEELKGVLEDGGVPW